MLLLDEGSFLGACRTSHPIFDHPAEYFEVVLDVQRAETNDGSEVGLVFNSRSRMASMCICNLKGGSVIK